MQWTRSQAIVQNNLVTDDIYKPVSSNEDGNAQFDEPEEDEDNVVRGTTEAPEATESLAL